MSEQEHHVATTANQPLGTSGGANESVSTWGREGSVGSGPVIVDDAGRHAPDPWEGYSIEVLSAVLDP